MTLEDDVVNALRRAQTLTRPVPANPLRAVEQLRAIQYEIATALCLLGRDENYGVKVLPSELEAPTQPPLFS